MYICVSMMPTEHDRMKFVLSELMLGLALWFSTTDWQTVLMVSE